MPTMRKRTAKQQLPTTWSAEVGAEFKQPYFRKLEDFLTEERRRDTVYPPADEVFAAFWLTPFDKVKVLLLGQDPYHDANQAHGLAFSVRPGVRPPPSLVNIFKELKSDLGCRIPNNGYLVPWAEQGVMLLNAVLTVRAHAPNSHRNKGWETFTDTVIRALSARKQPIVFVFWGANAQKKIKLVDTKRHALVESVHPSPLSARHGFFGSKPFSQINAALHDFGDEPIDWQIPDN